MPNLPAWAALPTAFLVLLGAGLTLIGALRFGTVFERVHAPTIGDQANERRPAHIGKMHSVRGLWRTRS